MEPQGEIDLGPRYRFLRRLGEGGIGAVFLVHDSYLEKELALKLLHRAPAGGGSHTAGLGGAGHPPGIAEAGAPGPGPPQGEMEDVQREFVLLSRLDHPGLARSYDFGFLEGRPFFTREYVPGEPPGGTGPLEADHLIRLGSEVAEALDFLHRNQVLHLDVKPGNIILRHGSPRRAVLIDFGLSRRGFIVGATGQLKGTLPYMAPEYFRGEPLGPWTDIYALGVTLYRLATGRFPRAFDRGADPSPPEWDPAPPPPSRLRPSLPHDLDHIVLRCLALDTRSRFASCEEVLRSLEILGGGISPRTRSGSPALLTVGREAELEEADRYLEDLLGPRSGPAALFVTCQSGMGLTHYLGEVKTRAQTRGIPCYLETGFPGRPGPPGSLLRSLGSHMGNGKEDARARWEAFLARLGKPRRPSQIDTSEGERRLRRASEVALAAAAVSGAILLAVDDLQFCDEISLGLIIDLIRFLGEEEPRRRPAVGLLLGYREAGASVALLRELTDELLKRGRTITLGPLDFEETLELHRSLSGKEGAAEIRRGPGPLTLFARTGGCPRSIALLSPPGGERLPPAHAPRPAARTRLGEEERRVFLTMKLLRRPSGGRELGRIARVPGDRAARAISKLAELGLAVEVDSCSSGKGWVVGPEAGRAGSPDPRRASREVRELHSRIARQLSRGSAGDPEFAEAVSHFRLAGDPAAVVRCGIPAARYLKSTFQNRAALDVLATVLAILPRRRSRLRLEVALEMADLAAQVGDFEEGIRILQEFLPGLRTLPRPARLRTSLRLATLYARRGDFGRADGLFTEVLGEARGAGAGLSRDEVLFFLNEHAMIKAFRGHYPEALALSAEGLSLAGGSRAFATRELVLNLHATRANVALRTFDFAGAARDFERALEIAEAIGSPVNQAVVLNNLGIVYGQSDRTAEAIRAFREAERTCLRLDEGPSLASIHGNLAVLYSKRGDFEAMERALGEAGRLSPAGTGRRQEFFLRHEAGLCRINRGRYAEAIPHLEAAIRMGEEMGDRHVVAFDEVYRAEALIFTGRYAAASGELEKSSGGKPAGSVRRMALCRLAFLSALTARPEALESAVDAWRETSSEREVPFLEAWNGLFLGWALSLGGDADGARSRLDAAETFFRECDLAPALSLVRWVRAEALFLAGDAAGARQALSASRPGSDLTRALRPLLLARIVLEGRGDAGGLASAADLLAEAGAAMVGNPLPEWSVRLAALRAICQGPTGADRAEVERGRAEMAGELPEEDRRRYFQARHWKAWTSGLEETGVKRPKISRARDGGDRPLPPDTKTRSMEGKAAPSARAGLATRSRAMRKLAATLERLRESDLPVLIRGETGTGKELVARIIHQESRRAGAPFLVVDCSAIPSSLLEVELFGARAGSFTDLREDRRGILSLAAGGTVLIDEIGELTLELQAKLLRVISERSVRPLGSEREERLDVRFLFSTARDLEEEMEKGRFRRDLFHRIDVVSVPVPPLRERPEDLEDLVTTFLGEVGSEPPRLGPGVIDRLRTHPWPGNVRELRNLLARLRVEDASRIDRESVEAVLGDPETTTVFPRNLLAGETLPGLQERLERDYLVYHIRRLKFETQALCRFLRLGRRQFYRRLERLRISLRKERQKL